MEIFGFRLGANKMSIQVKSELGGEIIVRSDTKDGKIIGQFTIPKNTDWSIYKAQINHISDIHALWIECKGPVSEESELFSIDWFAFE